MGHSTLPPDPEFLFTGYSGDPIPCDVTGLVTLQPDGLDCADDSRCCSDYLHSNEGPRDCAAAILPVSVDVSHEEISASSRASTFAPVSNSELVFTTPSFPDTIPVSIYGACLKGICSCVHLIGGLSSQLMPCRAAPFLFGASRLDSMDDNEVLFLWKGLSTVSP